MIKFYSVLLFWGVTCFNVVASDLSIRRQAVKTTILSWYTGSCKVSYERAIFNNQTMEITGGYIGVGHDNFKNQPKGITARYAQKFILYGNDVQPLNGFYLRPELIFTHFRYDTKVERERMLSKMGSAVFTVGYQYALHYLIVDFFVGGGYAFGYEADTYYQHGFALWDFLGRNNKNIDVTFGIKIGVGF